MHHRRFGFHVPIVYPAHDEDLGASRPSILVERLQTIGGTTMRLIKLACVIGLLALGLLSPSRLQAARPDSTGALEPAAREFTACPLPIPNCIPEYVFDFKKCRCVPRP
jgi:hypothetical protein